MQWLNLQNVNLIQNKEWLANISIVHVDSKDTDQR